MVRRLSLLSATVLALGCQSPALVRSARTLPAGGDDLSLSVTLTRVSLRPVDVEGTRLPLQDFNLPNPIPDVLYDHGLTDDVQIGARLSLGSGLIEARSMLRVVHTANGKLHVALAPAAGYRVLALVNGPVFSVPAIVTYDLSPNMSLTGGPLVAFASYSVPRALDAGEPDLGGSSLYAGGGVGLELRPAFGLHVMPALEVQRSVWRGGRAQQLPVVDMVFFGLTFGWGSRAPSP